MLKELRPTFVMLALFTVLTGLVYPLLMTGVAQAAFRHQANGSLILHEGKAVGSSLIGQPFTDPKYFWSRLSATSPTAYNGGSSSGSNLGPTNPVLTDAVKARLEALQKADPDTKGPVPVDLVTASASGLDPHISVAAAEYQVHRVAKARGMDEARVRVLIAEHTTGRQLAVLGEPGVNVLELNLALDSVR